MKIQKRGSGKDAKYWLLGAEPYIYAGRQWTDLGPYDSRAEAEESADKILAVYTEMEHAT